MKCLLATFARRMHRKPISCQRGSEIGLFAGKRCRVVMQNAHNGDFAQTRQGDAALHNQARRLRRAAPPGYMKRPAPRRPSPTGNVKVTNQKCQLYRNKRLSVTPSLNPSPRGRDSPQKRRCGPDGPVGLRPPERFGFGHMDGQNAHKPGSSLFSGIVKDEPPAGEADKADERAEGRREGSLAVLKAMLQAGYSPEGLCNISGASINEIEALQ